MSFRKRTIPEPLSYSPLPANHANESPAQVSQAMNQSTLTGIIDQLGALFLFSHEVFNELSLYTGSLTERIGSLNSRMEVLHEYLPQVENYMSQSHVANLLGANAVVYKAPAPEEYQFLTRETRPPSLQLRHNETKAPPNFALLDACFPDDPSCMKH